MKQHQGFWKWILSINSAWNPFSVAGEKSTTICEMNLAWDFKQRPIFGQPNSDGCIDLWANGRKKCKELLKVAHNLRSEKTNDGYREKYIFFHSKSISKCFSSATKSNILTSIFDKTEVILWVFLKYFAHHLLLLFGFYSLLEWFCFMEPLLFHSFHIWPKELEQTHRHYITSHRITLF